MTPPAIDTEFQSLMPQLSTEELKGLEAAIRREGCREPLVIWEGCNLLLDGHNRLAICLKLGLPFHITALPFANRDEARQWVIDHQLARRNLTDEQRAYFMGLDYLNRKRPHGDEKRLEKPSISPSGQNDHLGEPEAQGPAQKAEELVAEKHGASPRTVRRNAEFAEAVDAHAAADPAARNEILSGTSGKTKQEVIASAPPVCDRCRRVGIVKGCSGCEELRRPKETRPAPHREKNEQKPKSGREKFPWKDWPKHYGTIVRMLEQLQESYPAERDSQDAQHLFRLINEYGTVWNTVKDRLIHN